MKRRTIILGSVEGFFLFLFIKNAFKLIRLGWLLVLAPLFGVVLAIIVSLFVLWLLWR